MLNLFLVDELPKSGPLEISGDEAKHAISALRVKVGEEIALSNGMGMRAVGKVVAVGKKNLIVEIQSTVLEEAGLVQLVVVQALTKGDRARETIELLTEAGVHKIIPWSAARSIGNWKEDSLERWITWSREATKQSRRSWVPNVVSTNSTNQITALISEFDLAMIFEEGATQKLSEILQLKQPNSVLIIIGPEGGITEQEAMAFEKAGAISVVMGNSVFRSAHAGVAALAAVQTGLKIW